MLGTSAAEYAFIRIFIFILHYIAPLSFLYCIIITMDPAATYRIRPAVELWIFAEALFWTCFKTEVTDPDQFIQGWFKGAEIKDIRRDEVKEWLAWAFFDRDYEGREDEDEIEEYTLEIESMLRKDFRPGKGTVKPLKLTIDPVDMLHRSLLWYFVSTLFAR